jgi:DNA polymerase-3 subunit delta'
MEILSNQLRSNRLSNAYIFESEDQDFVFQQALFFSKEVFEKKGIFLENDLNPDLKIIEAENKNISIDQVRFLIKDMYLSPSNNKIKIYIIKESQNLSIESSNALLKTIEEAKEYAIIILTTSNSYALLPTIRSRCQIISFNKAKDLEEVDQDILYKILFELMTGNLASYYENKDFFQKYKEKKYELVDSMLNFYLLLLRSIYDTNTEQEFNKKYLFYEKRMKNLSFDTINDLVDKIEEVKKGFANNVNYDLSIENIIFYIYRKAGDKC